MKMIEGWSLRASEKSAATSLFDSPNLAVFTKVSLARYESENRTPGFERRQEEIRALLTICQSG